MTESEGEDDVDGVMESLGVIVSEVDGDVVADGVVLTDGDSVVVTLVDPVPLGDAVSDDDLLSLGDVVVLMLGELDVDGVPDTLGEDDVD